jgi:hypothetical protein
VLGKVDRTVIIPVSGIKATAVVAASIVEFSRRAATTLSSVASKVTTGVDGGVGYSMICEGAMSPGVCHSESTVLC